MCLWRGSYFEFLRLFQCFVRSNPKQIHSKFQFEAQGGCFFLGRKTSPLLCFITEDRAKRIRRERRAAKVGGWGMRSEKCYEKWLVVFKYTPGSTDIAGWKMDPDWRCISYSKWRYSIAILVSQRVFVFFHPEIWGRLPFWRTYFSERVGSTTN